MSNSIWSLNDKNEFPVLNKDIETEVLVIGGGLSGILCAYNLEKEGYKVAVLEADRIASKKTLKTTATITALQDVMYHNLIKDFGYEKAKLFLMANLEAVKHYEELNKKYDFDFELCPSYKYSLEKTDEINDEYEAIRALGCKVSIVTDIDLPLKIHKAIKLENQAQMNPIKLINELSKTLTIFEKTPVEKIKNNIAYTDRFKVKFKKVIICTGFPFLKIRGLYSFRMHQEKSHVIAIKENKGFKGNAIGINSSDLYFRNYEDYLIVGANDVKTGTIINGFEDINKFLVSNYNIKNITNRWINEDCVPLDDIPYIGRLTSGTENMFVLTGFNLWGMTAAMIGSHLITDLIKGEPNKYYELYTPQRKVLIKPLFENILSALKGLISLKTKRCSHLGCKLEFNHDDGCYECGCHGSRYDKDGNVIETPAQKKIKIAKD